MTLAAATRSPGLGWDAGWEAAFAPFAAAGRRPARVVAVHKETASCAATAAATARPPCPGGSGSTRSPRPTSRPSATGSRSSRRRRRLCRRSGGHRRGAPRRSAFVRSAADASRRTAGNLVDEQVIAANVDIAFLVAGLDGDFNLRRWSATSRSPGPAASRPVVVLNKADIGRDIEGRLVAVEGDRARRADRRRSPR